MTASPPHDEGRAAGPEPADAIGAHQISEPDQTSDPHGQWWVDGPMFSTEHKASSITSLRPGARPGRFTASMVARLSFTFVFWIGFAFLALPRIVEPIAAPTVKDLATHW